MVLRKKSAPGQGKTSVPPSRLRYERANPAVTIRIPAELKQRLVQLKESRGVSMAEVFRIGLGTAEPALHSAFLEGSYQGYEEGYEEAKEEFEVTYDCSLCRQRHLSITSQNEKEAAAQMMYDAGWHSTECA